MGDGWMVVGAGGPCGSLSTHFIPFVWLAACYPITGATDQRKDCQLWCDILNEGSASVA